MPKTETLKECITIISGNLAGHPKIPNLLGYDVTTKDWYYWHGANPADMLELSIIPNVRPICLVDYTAATLALQLPDLGQLVTAILEWHNNDFDAIPLGDLRTFLNPILAANKQADEDNQEETLN